MNEPLSTYIEPRCLAWQGVTCRACVTTCGHGAIRFRTCYGYDLPVVDPALCRGCRTCTVYCPYGALEDPKTAA